MPRIIALLVAAALVAPPAPAQHRVTTPRQALGFDVGADYHLATYTQLEAYWRTLARESPRLVLREIGKSAEGRPQLMAIITAADNHRDFYMVTQPETEHMARVMFREWFPQIVYNHHQTGPAGTVLFAPPFRDPFNYYYDPLVPIGIDMVAAAMHERFLAEGKPGATMRSGAPYSTWW